MTQQRYSENEVVGMHNANQGNPQPIGGKPGLLDLINKHHVSTVHLARAARLRIATVRAMALQGKPVQPVVAMQVLYGLWELTGERYVLTDVDIPTLSYNGK
jgi:hypothetical protein